MVGKNLQGTIQDWIVPDDWLCLAYYFKDLRMGTMDGSQMLEVEFRTFRNLTWPMRTVGSVKCRSNAVEENMKKKLLRVILWAVYASWLLTTISNQLETH